MERKTFRLLVDRLLKLPCVNMTALTFGIINIPVIFDRTEFRTYADVEVDITKQVNINTRTLLSKENNA